MAEDASLEVIKINPHLLAGFSVRSFALAKMFAPNAYCDANAADLKAASAHYVAVNKVNNRQLPESARQCLSRNLRELRAAKGFSQEDLALESGLHRTFVAHVERGARNISLDNIEKLATSLGVRCADLLRDEPSLK